MSPESIRALEASVPYMTSDNWIDRLAAEYVQATVRFHDVMFEHAPMSEHWGALIEMQKLALHPYQRALRQRLVEALRGLDESGEFLRHITELTDLVDPYLKTLLQLGLIAAL